MVRVYRKDIEKEITFGELLEENEKTFKIHSSSQYFEKKDYYYKKEI